MQASPGDRLIIKGHSVGDDDRDAEILQVRGPGGTPPFVVRWSDSGHETLFFPGPDAVVQHFGIVGPEDPVLEIGDVVRLEHRALFAEAHRLLDAADALDDEEMLPDAVHEAYAWAATDVVPHARVEDHTIYPVVVELLGAERAIDPMRREHVEIERLVQRLGELREQARTRLSPGVRRNLRQVLYGLHAVLTLHLATEEEVYVPLLEASLTAKRSQRLAEEVRAGETPPETVPVLR